MNYTFDSSSLGGWTMASWIFSLIIIALALWSIPWKGVALWKAAKQNNLAWFVVLLIVNTVGILEILYIFIFSKMGKGKTK